MPVNQTWPEVTELPLPLQCVACGYVARWLVDGTSVCERHRPSAILTARQKREG